MSETAKSCETCRYDLGGGFDHCVINLEDECGKGGYEAWEAKNEAPDRYMVLKGLVSCGPLCARTDCPYYPILHCERKLHNDAIALLRAVDAAPVVHGQWKAILNPVWDAKCSECGYMTRTAWEWRFCPYCGAKMDEE